MSEQAPAPLPHGQGTSSLTSDRLHTHRGGSFTLAGHLPAECIRRHGALLAILVVGGALRTALLIGYRPAILANPDTWGYVRAAAGPLFHGDDVRPVGYALVLRGLHALSPTITFAIAFQHFLGLACALLAYATVRRMGWPRWVALAPAAVLALSPDFLYFEHSLLSETVFTFLLLAALYATVRSIEIAGDEGSRRGALGWVAAAGAFTAGALTARSSGLVVLAPVVLAVVSGRSGIRQKTLSFTVVLVGAGAVAGAYGVAHHASTGSYGLDGGGWALYARAAPFADCRRFMPAEGTAVLCESTEPRQRFGGDYYAWHEGSPARRLFVGPPFHDREVGAFGRAAIRAQPADYFRAVARDLWRYVDVGATAPLYSGNGPGALELDQRDPGAEATNRFVVEPYYGRYQITVGGFAHGLAALQPVLRVHGPLVLIATVLALLAVLLTRGRGRAQVMLLAGTAIIVPVSSVGSAIYGWRYLVPVLPELVAAGAMGASLVGRRLVPRRRCPLPLGIASGHSAPFPTADGEASTAGDGERLPATPLRVSPAAPA